MQTVTNLLHNAIEYTDPHGTITLAVSTSKQELVLAVQDTGVGISAAEEAVYWELMPLPLDGMAPMFTGERTFTLTPRADGTTDFEMVEIFAGVMLPMIKGSLPDFGPVFDRYAFDLKKEAEREGSAS